MWIEVFCTMHLIERVSLKDEIMDEGMFELNKLCGFFL